MMNRILSSILIPFLLVSQSLFSVPHSHAETSVVEPEGHAVRPHIHLHGSGHRHDTDHDPGHHDGDGPPLPDSQVPDHDSDAIYASDIQLLSTSKISKVAKAELSAINVLCDESATISGTRVCTQFWLFDSSHTMQRSKCALYLQQLAIRC